MPHSPYLYLRGLRHVAHTVFAVQDGQKFYRDPQTGIRQAYASGQQVKRGVLEAMQQLSSFTAAPVTFNWQVLRQEKKGETKAQVKFEQKEAWSPCDPSYPDQLVGGYMRAEVGTQIIKRRSPLSISLLRPLHPLLGGLESEAETITFDRTDRGAHNVVRVRDEGGEELPAAELAELLASTGRILPSRIYMPGQTRATGLYVYDVCLDLRTLFCVGINPTEPQLGPGMLEKLLDLGWKKTENYFGPALVAPQAVRERLIPALAQALLSWRITTNQARTFSLQETLAVAISPQADAVGAAIRARLYEESEGGRQRARPIIDHGGNAQLFVTPAAEAHVLNSEGKLSALADAEATIRRTLEAYPYANQLAGK